MKCLTRKQFDRIVQECEQASRGPWEASAKRYGFYEIFINNRQMPLLSGYLKEADAKFIAHAREDVEVLLSVVLTMAAKLGLNFEGDDKSNSVFYYE